MQSTEFVNQIHPDHLDPGKKFPNIYVKRLRFERALKVVEKY